MNDVLSGIQLALAKLPQWQQIAVIAGITLLGVLARRKLGPQPLTPTTPVTPSAATVPAPLAGLGGIVHDALVLLGKVPKSGATINDVDHDTLMKLDAGLQAIKAAKAEAHTAALADLKPTDPAASTAAK